MAVSLSVTTVDPELEKLLDYLDTHDNHPHTESKIRLLEKATKWLRASLDIAYDSFPNKINIVLETRDSAACTSAPPH